MSWKVLDTDILTHYQLGQPDVVRRVTSFGLAELAITVITVEEQLTGWYAKLRRSKKQDELLRTYKHLANGIEMVARFKVLTFTEASLDRYEQFKAQKLNIGKNDLKIAAITLDHQATLVTRNLRDFHRIPNLMVEDWSK